MKVLPKLEILKNLNINVFELRSFTVFLQRDFNKIYYEEKRTLLIYKN